jgi:hypothetical protein
MNFYYYYDSRQSGKTTKAIEIYNSVENNVYVYHIYKFLSQYMKQEGDKERLFELYKMYFGGEKYLEDFIEVERTYKKLLLGKNEEIINVCLIT